MISNTSASAGSASSASATRPSRFASSLCAGKKYDSLGSRPGGDAVAAPATADGGDGAIVVIEPPPVDR